jgi:hypothetical protein
MMNYISKFLVEKFPTIVQIMGVENIRLYCAQNVGSVSASFDNIDDERRLFHGFVK